MTSRTPDLDRLIEVVYEAPLEEVPWRNALAVLRQRLGCAAVTLILRPPAEGDSGLILSEGGTSDWESAYSEHYFALAPERHTSHPRLRHGRARWLRSAIPRLSPIRGRCLRIVGEATLRRSAPPPQACPANPLSDCARGVRARYLRQGCRTVLGRGDLPRSQRQGSADESRRGASRG